MKKITTLIIASSLAMATAVTALVPADAAPLRMMVAPAAASSDSSIVQVRDAPRFLRHGNRSFRNADRRGWYRGHRGYRDYRPGYRRHGNFWYPGAAFAAGALTGAIIGSQSGVRVQRGSSHVQWCYDRYRSYRASDNTYQPNSGPRRQCVSP